MIQLFAFDPGQTTGYCVMQINVPNRTFEVVRCDEIEWDVRLENTMDVMAAARPQDLIVIESFRLFPHKANAQVGSIFPSVRMIGIIETMAYYANINSARIRYQEPGDIAKVAVMEEDLHWVKGSPHKGDAYRHARLFFLKHIYINPFSTPLPDSGQQDVGT